MTFIYFILCAFLPITVAFTFLTERLDLGSIRSKIPTAAIVGIIGTWVGSSLVGPGGPNLEVLYEFVKERKQLETIVGKTKS